MQLPQGYAVLDATEFFSILFFASVGLYLSTRVIADRYLEHRFDDHPDRNLEGTLANY